MANGTVPPSSPRARQAMCYITTWHDTDINYIHEDVSNAVLGVRKTHTVRCGIIGIRNLSTGRI